MNYKIAAKQIHAERIALQKAAYGWSEIEQVDAMNAAGKAAERAGYAIRSVLVQSALDAETAMINLANAFRRLQP